MIYSLPAPKKIIYFEKEQWGGLSIQHKQEFHHFNCLMDLFAFLQVHYGDDFELFEVTEENHRELLESGAFDDQ